MYAQTLVALFSWLIGASAIGTYTFERFLPAAQLDAPQLILHELAHRGSGRMEPESEQITFLI